MEKLRQVDKIDTAAYLLYEKFKPVDVNIRARKILFFFEDTPELKTALLSFFNHTARVDPQEYNNQMKMVIRLMQELLKEEVTDHE